MFIGEQTLQQQKICTTFPVENLNKKDSINPVDRKMVHVNRDSHLSHKYF